MLNVIRSMLKFVKSRAKPSIANEKIMEVIAKSLLFDKNYYSENYPYTASYSGPIEHYVAEGAGLGFNPSGFFHSKWYLDTYADVRRAGVNPLFHYIRFGAGEGRRPNPWFDAAEYSQLNGLDSGEPVRALTHFMHTLVANEDEQNARSNPALEYMKRDPDGAIDTRFYRRYYHDIQDLSERDLIQHYRTTGKVEGRYPNVHVAISALSSIHGDLPRDFDEEGYLRHYENVAREYAFEGGGKVHYLQFGRYEGLKVKYREVYDAHRLHLMMNRIYDLPDVVVENDQPCRINVLVPAFEFKSMSAGFFGVFQVARFIAHCGYRVRLVMFDNFYYNEAEFRQKLLGYPGMENLFDEMEVEYIGERKAPLVLSPQDNCVATVWYSAHFANKIMSKVGKRPFLYLIQDYETNFYAGSASYSAAEASYQFKYNALFSSQTLQDTFVEHGIGIFGKNPPRSMYFNNACARRKPAEDFLARSSTRRKLAFYCRPGVNRNMFELGALALCEAYRRGLFGDQNWEFYGVGLGDTAIQLAPGVWLEQMPRLNLADYQQAIGAFDMGLCLMASPHPSLLPFDLGGSGAIVVTNNFGVKDQAYFDRLCKNVISMEPNLETIIAGMKTAIARLEDKAARYENAVNMRFPDDWSQTFDLEHEAFIRKCFGQSRLKDLPTVRPKKRVAKK